MQNKAMNEKVADARTLPMARSMCWHCQSEVNGEYLCGRCVKVQPLSTELDYFSCLNLPRKLNIDQNEIESTFYQLNRVFHPDYHAQGDDPNEKTISLGNSALVNTAYRTLRDPIQRAEYLIRLEAGSAKDIRTAPPADLFEEILELQDDMEAFRSHDPQEDSEEMTALRRTLQKAQESLTQRLQQLDTQLFDTFKVWDALQEENSETEDVRVKKENVLKEMQGILSNRTYVRNIVNDVIETTK